MIGIRGSLIIWIRGVGVTAGGVNYFSRAAQIENAKNEYIKGLGIPPGPPTMKGIYAEPEYTGKGFPDGGTPVQDPPRGWPRKPVFNPPGGPPGPPIQWGDELTNETVEPGFGYIGTGAIPENDQYFYHPDHLGSTAYVTNITGAVCQFFVYLPYGEALVDKHTSPWKVPYTFSAKEQDVETKLTYFEARYYDAKYTTFLSIDPLWAKYPHISPYVYCNNNPINMIDPDGREAWKVTRQWSRSDISKFAEYSRQKIQEFKGNKTKDDCANFAVRLIVEYASENGLPLTLMDRWGNEFDASSDIYSSTTQYLNAARVGIQAADLPSNSFEIEPSKTQSGDFQVIQYEKQAGKTVDFQHVAIFETRQTLVYGNLPPDVLKSVGSSYWSRGSLDKTLNDWHLLTGSNNSRWNVLNPANMPKELPLQKLQIPYVPVESIKISGNSSN